MNMQQIAEGYGMRGLSIPAKGEVWKHHSGRLYRVDELRNADTPTIDVQRFPVEVCYTQIDTGWKFARRLDDWHRSFGNNAVPVDTPKPYFSIEPTHDTEDLWSHCIRKRPVINVGSDGAKSISMGFILALVDGEINAKIITETLNAAFPPNPNEPKD